MKKSGRIATFAAVLLLMLASFGSGLLVMGVYTVFEIFRREGRNRRARTDMSRMADRMRSDGTRSRIVSNITVSSRRARLAPRQKCGPPPNAT